MSRQIMASTSTVPDEDRVLPLDQSAAQNDLAGRIREVHRLFGRVLQQRIGQLGLTLGTWYFLRALWEEDGLSQRELSQRIGTMEPTTVSALNSMERLGLVHRERDPNDKRRRRVFLTDYGRSLRGQALSLLGDLDREALEGFGSPEVGQLYALLDGIAENLRPRHGH